MLDKDRHPLGTEALGIYVTIAGKEGREATGKEHVAQTLVAPGDGTLAQDTGFSLEEDGSVSHCVVTSQTNRHPEIFS